MKVYVGDIVMWLENDHATYGKAKELNFLTHMIAVKALGENDLQILAISFILEVYRRKRKSPALTI